MTKDLDHKVAQAMGFKSVNDCASWGAPKEKDPEDEAFEELALKQGQWNHTSGWRKKQIQGEERLRQGEEHMTEYTLKTYDTMRVYVPAGMYSIAELDQLLADMIEAKKQQDEHLKTSMQSLKEKNT